MKTVNFMYSNSKPVARYTNTNGISTVTLTSYLDNTQTQEVPKL